MTHNVLQYLANQETARTNLAKEQETYRSNLVKEQETERSNRAKEAETNRYNTAYLQELNRSNVRKENISAFEAAEKQRSNQATEGINLLNARTRGLELAEERRSNKVTESQGSRKLDQGDVSLNQQWKTLDQRDRELMLKEVQTKLAGINISMDILQKIFTVAGRFFY